MRVYQINLLDIVHVISFFHSVICLWRVCRRFFQKIRCIAYFSLSELVEAPDIARNISWVENCWPKKPPDDRFEFYYLKVLIQSAFNFEYLRSIWQDVFPLSRLDTDFNLNCFLGKTLPYSVGSVLLTS